MRTGRPGHWSRTVEITARQTSSSSFPSVLLVFLPLIVIGGLFGPGPDDMLRRPYSESTQRTVDEEVARLLRQAEARAVGLPRSHRDQLDELAALVKHETVDGRVVLRSQVGRV